MAREISFHTEFYYLLFFFVTQKSQKSQIIFLLDYMNTIRMAWGEAHFCDFCDFCVRLKLYICVK